MSLASTLLDAEHRDWGPTFVCQQQRNQTESAKRKRVHVTPIARLNQRKSGDKIKSAQKRETAVKKTRGRIS